MNSKKVHRGFLLAKEGSAFVQVQVWLFHSGTDIHVAIFSIYMSTPKRHIQIVLVIASMAFWQIPCYLKESSYSLHFRPIKLLLKTLVKQTPFFADCLFHQKKIKVFLSSLIVDITKNISKFDFKSCLLQAIPEKWENPITKNPRKTRYAHFGELSLRSSDMQVWWTCKAFIKD